MRDFTILFIQVTLSTLSNSTLDSDSFAKRIIVTHKSDALTINGIQEFTAFVNFKTCMKWYVLKEKRLMYSKLITEHITGRYDSKISLSIFNKLLKHMTMLGLLLQLFSFTQVVGEKMGEKVGFLNKTVKNKTKAGLLLLKKEKAPAKYDSNTDQ